MSEGGSAPAGWADLAEALLGEDLVRAVASGRRRDVGPEAVRWRRAEVRWVELKAGRHLQVSTFDATQAFVVNHAAGPAAEGAVAELVAAPFAEWRVERTDDVLRGRVSRRGDLLLRREERAEPVVPARGHDRAKDRLLPADDPVFAALGISDRDGRVKPSRQAKYRQVEEFLRLLDVAVTEARRDGVLRRPTPEDPLRLVDLGCGNAYLTVAAHRFLTHVRGLPMRVVGVDVKQQSRDHNAAVARGLGVAESELAFVVGGIDDVRLDPAPEVVLALHACDTATDDALARAVGWDAAVVLAAPCCHHDVAAQLRRLGAATPPAFGEVLRHGILRERLADTLTDTLRASLLRRAGYRVDVVEFVDPTETPRNTMLRAVRAPGALDGPGRPGGDNDEYAALTAQFGLRPRLGELLAVGSGADGGQVGVHLDDGGVGVGG